MINRRMFLRLLIFGVTFLTFARLNTYGFTWWDDEDTVSQNPRLTPPTWETLSYYWTTAGEHETMGLYVPVTYTVWSGIARIAGLDHPDAQGFTLNAKYFHTANVLLHAMTALLVFQLLWRLFGNETAAAIGALIFSLHPVQVEPVGWVSGTKDLLCGFFAVSALLMYVRSVQIKSADPYLRWARRWRYCSGITLFVLAMLSKPTGVVVPVMAGAIGVLLLGRTIWQTAIKLIPWFLLMIPCIIWTQRVQPPTWLSPLSIWARPAVAADAVAFYLCKLIWPAHLCIDYGRNPMFIAANHAIDVTWMLSAAVACLLWWRFHRLRPAVACALIFVLPLLPVLGFIPFEFQVISTTSDHYLYLPMLGVAIVACWVMSRNISIPMMAGTVLILITLGIRSVLAEAVWKDTRTLFEHTLAINPRSTVSMDGLGFLTGRDARRLLDAGKPNEARVQFDESIKWYRKSLENSPGSAPSMTNLALDYQKIGREDLGQELLHRIVELDPTLPPGKRAEPLTVAHLLLNFDDIPGAIAWLDDVLRRDPGNFQAAILRKRAIRHLQSTSQPLATPPSHQ